MWLDVATITAANHDAGAPLDNCWGVIDGTARPIAHPVRNQRIKYVQWPQEVALPEISCN